MSKKLFTVLGITFGTLAVAGVFFAVRERNAKQEVALDNQTVSEQKDVASPQGKDEPSKESYNKTEFVTDVDPDVNHWQTKEIETFSVKFPKEWYWLASDLKKAGYYSEVITNNSNFDINKYSDIGLFAGGSYPLILTNDAEIVVTLRGWSTRDSGTPQESIDAIVNTPMGYDPDTSETCKQTSPSGVVPTTAFCSFADKNHQKVQTYYIAYNTTTFAFTARTTENNITDQRGILEKIAKSFTVKDKSFN